MKELIQKILDTNNLELMDKFLIEADVHIKLYDDSIVKYIGGGMVKSVAGIEDLSMEKFVGLMIGKLPAPVKLVLSTEDNQPKEEKDDDKKVNEVTPPSVSVVDTGEKKPVVKTDGSSGTSKTDISGANGSASTEDSQDEKGEAGEPSGDSKDQSRTTDEAKSEGGLEDTETGEKPKPLDFKA